MGILPDFLNLKELLKDAFLPPLCASCGKISGQFLCTECLSSIAFLGEDICLRCGSPLSSEDSGCRYQGNKRFDKKISGYKICSLCKQESFHFYRARSFSLYCDAVSVIIKKYKYKGYDCLGKIITGFLKHAFYFYYGKEKIDYIETVPVYGNGTIQVNHMQILAADLAECLRIPYGSNIIKIRQTSKQQKLDRAGRKINLAGAFKVKNCLQSYGKNYLVIDDVWTTGSTLNEISSALKNAGADRIYVLSVARGA